MLVLQLIIVSLAVPWTVIGQTVYQDFGAPPFSESQVHHDGPDHHTSFLHSHGEGLHHAHPHDRQHSHEGPPYQGGQEPLYPQHPVQEPGHEEFHREEPPFPHYPHEPHHQGAHHEEVHEDNGGMGALHGGIP